MFPFTGPQSPFVSVVACLAAVILSGGSAIESSCASTASAAGGATQRRFAAVAFDYFVLFNADSVVADAERIVPGKGRALTDAWRTRQFEYAWLRSMSGRYVDFSQVTDDALVYAADALRLELSASQRAQLNDAYRHLTPWPDAAGALRRLRQSGIRVIALANFSPSMLRDNADRAGLTSLFDALISTDENRSYKPDPRAYQLGVDHLRLPKQNIVFAAFGGWDAAGAASFGYPTVWVNRFNQPAEQLGARPDRTVHDLDGLVDFVLNPAAR